MKKAIYITLFALLGFLGQLLIHGLVEILYINLLIKDFAKYSLGFSWQEWFLIHHIATVILFLAGVALGFWQGKYWWKRVYKKTNK